MTAPTYIKFNALADAKSICDDLLGRSPLVDPRGKQVWSSKYLFDHLGGDHAASDARYRLIRAGWIEPSVVAPFEIRLNIPPRVGEAYIGYFTGFHPTDPTRTEHVVVIARFKDYPSKFTIVTMHPIREKDLAKFQKEALKWPR